MCAHFLNSSSDDDSYYLSYSSDDCEDGYFDREKSLLLQLMFSNVYKYYVKNHHVQLELQDFLQSRGDTTQAELDRVEQEIEKAKIKRDRFKEIAKFILVYPLNRHVVHVLELNPSDVYMTEGRNVTREEFVEAVHCNKYCHLHVRSFCPCKIEEILF